MKAAFAPRVNLVRRVAEVANYPCWLIKSRTGTEAHEKISLVRQSSRVYSGTPPYSHLGEMQSPFYYGKIFLAHL